MCPICTRKTRVRRGDAALLKPLIERASKDAPAFRVWVKNMAGGQVGPLFVTEENRVLDLKRLLYLADNMYDVHRQQLMMQLHYDGVVESDSEWQLLENQQPEVFNLGDYRRGHDTLAWHGITSECVLLVVMLDDSDVEHTVTDP